ncbi:MAG: dephospho-CoA kinase [Chloroflexi bacterium]|jgi:dephospho-CoA kinase|nr:dephospho-CoA kinase [Chloroflexota bacterium]
MSVYGLTGGIGAGKSTVANLFQESGIPVVLADDVGRQVASKGSDGLAEIVRSFGPDVLERNGELDRRKLGALIFNDPDRRRELEGILHPRVRDQSRELFNQLEQAGNQIVVYESALLYETQRHTEMRGVILVAASEEQRIARVRSRDGSEVEAVRQRIKAQMDDEEKRGLADYIIENNGDLQALRREVDSLIEQLLGR